MSSSPKHSSRGKPLPATVAAAASAASAASATVEGKGPPRARTPHLFNRYFNMSHGGATTTSASTEGRGGGASGGGGGSCKRPEWSRYVRGSNSSGTSPPLCAVALTSSSSSRHGGGGGSGGGGASSGAGITTLSHHSPKQQQLQQGGAAALAAVPPWRLPSDELRGWQAMCTGGRVRRRTPTGAHLWLVTEHDGVYPLAEAAVLLTFACERLLLLRATVPLPRGRGAEGDCDCFAATVQRLSNVSGGGGGGSGEGRATPPEPCVAYFGLGITAAAGDEAKTSGSGSSVSTGNGSSSSGFPMALLQLPEANAGPAMLFVGRWRVTEDDTLVQVASLRAPQAVRASHGGTGVALRLVVRDGEFDVCIDDSGADNSGAVAADTGSNTTNSISVSNTASSGGEEAEGRGMRSGADRSGIAHASVPAPGVRLGEALAIMVNSGGRVSVRSIAVAEGERPPESRVLGVIRGGGGGSPAAPAKSVSPPIKSSNEARRYRPGDDDDEEDDEEDNDHDKEDITGNANHAKTGGYSGAGDGGEGAFRLPSPDVKSLLRTARPMYAVATPPGSGAEPVTAAAASASGHGGDGGVSPVKAVTTPEKHSACNESGEAADALSSSNAGGCRTPGSPTNGSTSTAAQQLSPPPATPPPPPPPTLSAVYQGGAHTTTATATTRDQAVQTDIHIDPGLLQSAHLSLSRTPKARWEDRPLPPPPPGYLDDDNDGDGGDGDTAPMSNPAGKHVRWSRGSSSNNSTSAAGASGGGCGGDSQATSPSAFPFLKRGKRKSTTLSAEKQQQQQQQTRGRRHQRNHPQPSQSSSSSSKAARTRGRGYDAFDSSSGGSGGSGSDDANGNGNGNGGRSSCRVDPMERLKTLPPGVDPALAEVILAEVLDNSPGVDWADIAGLPDAKRLLKEAVLLPLLVPELFTGLVQPWRGVLLYGPPGTGKTLLAKAVATSAKTTFFSVSSALLNSKHYGESEKLVKTLFQIARLMAPSTIFFDEIDAVMSSRGGGGGADGGGKEHEASRRVKSEMLQQMDGITGGSAADGGGERVLVLATTNRPADLDEAIRRRLEKRIYIPLPDRESRVAQITRYAKCLNLGPVTSSSTTSTTISSSSTGKAAKGTTTTTTSSSSSDAYAYASLVEAVADRTEGYSGADLSIIVRDAAMAPVRRLLDAHTTDEIVRLKARGALTVSPVTVEDFIAAMDRVQPSVSPASLGQYAKYAATYGST